MTAGPVPVTREHWLNTIVGVLDSAFYLTEEEQFAVASIVSRLLTTLRIPERDAAAVLPMPVVQEAHAGVYSTQLASAAAGVRRPVRRVNEFDCATSLEAWRTGMENMFTIAYPNLEPGERILLSKVLNDLLAAIGVPTRVAAYFPDAVLRAHREIADN